VRWPQPPAASSSAPALAPHGGGDEEDQDCYLIAPPVVEPGRTVPASVPAAAPAPPPVPQQAPRRSGPDAGAGDKAPSFQAVLADLDSIEISTYGSAFNELSGGQASVQPDHAALRDFLVTNSAITMADIDTELLKIATQNESFCIDCDAFLTLLRENSVSDGDALEQFLNLSSNGESIAGEDCRSGLFNLTESRLGSTLKADQMERMFDTVMADMGLNVSMEQWILCSKKVGRIVRLVRYARISS